MARHAWVLLTVVALLTLTVPARADAAPRSPLPNGFLWGVSSSAFQAEGDPPDSNWTRYARSAKTPDDIGTSIDFRHRYREDIARAKALGVTVFRVGIEWARVEPRPGQIDRTELAYYDDLIHTIVAAGMRPMITLDHWVYPGWIANRGGWRDARTLPAWLRHNRMIVDRYAQFQPLWITINEPYAYVMNEVKYGGIGAADVPQMMNRLVTAHRSIYDYIHKVRPRAEVSSNVAYIPTAEPLLDAGFLDRVRDKLDYVGLDYYYSISPTDTSAINAATDQMWKASIAADGIYYALRDLGRRYPGKPLYVVEAGMPTENGKPRPDGYRRADHLRDLVYWVQRARRDGVRVVGFNYWSLTDNYEWGTYTPRFGLYTVNVKTDPSLRRIPTAAVSAYRSITAANGVGRAYRPTRPATVCSLVAAPASCLDPAH